MALFGDSILWGGYATTLRLAEPPAAGLVRMRPAYVVDDRSRNGDSAFAHMQQFLSGEVITSRMVVIEWGQNDATLSLPYEGPLRAEVQHVKALDKVAIVTGLSHTRVAGSNRDAYDAIARQVASTEGVAFADWGAAAFDPADMADDVHPAQAYSARLVAQLVAALDRVAPECRP